MDAKRNHKAVITNYGTYDFLLKKLDLFKNIISNKTKTIFIFKEMPLENFQVNIPGYEKWKIFDKEIKVNTQTIRKLAEFEDARVNETLFRMDHKIEIIINFLIKLKEDINIVPIILGKPNSKKLAEFANIVAKFINNDENSFIFLSYFLSKSMKEEKALASYKELKNILNEKKLKINNILDLYKSKRITSENIGGIMLSYKLFSQYLFSNYDFKSQGNDFLISEDILML